MAISGVARSPRFILGKTTKEQWNDELKNALAPWGEIEGKGIIFSLPLATLQVHQATLHAGLSQ